MKQIRILFSAVWLALLAATLNGCVTKDQPGARAGNIPVIFDTDIGDDIDDTWALGLLLKSPELDLKLVVGDRGQAR